ncbi:MAG: NB-ARC domain-containing protein [Anaerolineae bacterium]
MYQATHSPEISLQKLEEDIHQAFKTWHETKKTTCSPLDYLQIFQQIRLTTRSTPRQATNQLLLNALEILALEYPTEAELLRKRFVDGLVIHVLAKQLNMSEATVYRKQQEALKHLALTVLTLEHQARSEHQINLEKQWRLPPESTLFGQGEPLRSLLSNIVAIGSPWILSIEGPGGIGKTALANTLVRRPELLGRFEEIAWVSAKQQEFLPGGGLASIDRPALIPEALVNTLLEQLAPTVPRNQPPLEQKFILEQLLKQTPYLIVIDNLETVVDYQTLLPELRYWANPSKFILTSRYSLQAQPDIFCASLTELSPADTFHLIRFEANTRGLMMIANAGEADLRRIYEVVGGNPLALKLVIGQLFVLPLTQVLDNLKEARGQVIDELYTYIYWQAWHLLDQASQHTLLVMPIAQDGPFAQLLALTQLDIEKLSQALQQLVTLSLIQVVGDLEDRRYTIHRLTETFLLREVIKWQGTS